MGVESGLLAAAVAAFAVAWGVTCLCCRPGSWLYFLDHPNARSLHVRPTPRTGGVGVMAGVAAARWPLEVHVAPVRDVLTLDELNDQERWDLAVMYSTLLKRGNAFFDKGDGKGMDLPYIAAWHQAPIHDKRRENYRLNLQFFSFRRAANKIKYLAGSESGMAAWISDTTPELIAKRFHELGPIDIEG